MAWQILEFFMEVAIIKIMKMTCTGFVKVCSFNQHDGETLLRRVVLQVDLSIGQISSW